MILSSAFVFFLDLHINIVDKINIELSSDT